jgi:hypothetical protein
MLKYKKGMVFNRDFAFVIEKKPIHFGLGINYMHSTPMHKHYKIPKEFPRVRGIEIALFVYSVGLTWCKHIES